MAEDIKNANLEAWKKSRGEERLAFSVQDRIAFLQEEGGVQQAFLENDINYTIAVYGADAVTAAIGKMNREELDKLYAAAIAADKQDILARAMQEGGAQTLSTLLGGLSADDRAHVLTQMPDSAGERGYTLIFNITCVEEEAEQTKMLEAITAGLPREEQISFLGQIMPEVMYDNAVTKQLVAGLRIEERLSLLTQKNKEGNHLFDSVSAAEPEEVGAWFEGLGAYDRMDLIKAISKPDFLPDSYFKETFIETAKNLPRPVTAKRVEPVAPETNAAREDERKFSPEYIEMATAALLKVGENGKIRLHNELLGSGGIVGTVNAFGPAAVSAALSTLNHEQLDEIYYLATVRDNPIFRNAVHNDKDGAAVTAFLGGLNVEERIRTLTWGLDGDRVDGKAETMLHRIQEAENPKMLQAITAGLSPEDRMVMLKEIVPDIASDKNALKILMADLDVEARLNLLAHKDRNGVGIISSFANQSPEEIVAWMEGLEPEARGDFVTKVYKSDVLKEFAFAEKRNFVDGLVKGVKGITYPESAEQIAESQPDSIPEPAAAPLPPSPEASEAVLVAATEAPLPPPRQPAPIGVPDFFPNATTPASEQTSGYFDSVTEKPASSPGPEAPAIPDDDLAQIQAAGALIRGVNGAHLRPSEFVKKAAKEKSLEGIVQAAAGADGILEQKELQAALLASVDEKLKANRSADDINNMVGGAAASLMGILKAKGVIAHDGQTSRTTSQVVAAAPGHERGAGKGLE